MFYAGIGARKTPPEILKIMADVAEALASVGWSLSSGGQGKGADNAFELGCDRVNGGKRIFLPWPKFCGRDSEYDEPTYDSMLIASQFHPRWGGLEKGVKKLFARNVHVILGPNLVPFEYVKFVLCWTPEAKITGGTGHAIRIAEKYGIPSIWNLAEERAVDRVKLWIAQYKNKK